MRVADLMRRLPELRALDQRLSNPNWHPTAQDVADALAALAQHRAAKQTQLPLEGCQ